MAQNLIITTPRTSQIYYKPKSTNHERLGAILSVIENQCVIFESLIMYLCMLIALLPEHQALYAKVDCIFMYVCINVANRS